MLAFIVTTVIYDVEKDAFPYLTSEKASHEKRKESYGYKWNQWGKFTNTGFYCIATSLQPSAFQHCYSPIHRLDHKLHYPGFLCHRCRFPLMFLSIAFFGKTDPVPSAQVIVHMVGEVVRINKTAIFRLDF